MKKLSSHFSSEKGLTLIEILASMVLLSIIIVSLLSMFVQSSRSNNFSKNIMDATYVAETSMEELNRAVAISTDLSTFAIEVDKIINPVGTKRYTLISNINGQAIFAMTVPGHYVYIEALSNSGNPNVKVKIKVYKDLTKAKIEAQMEMLLPWKKL